MLMKNFVHGTAPQDRFRLIQSFVLFNAFYKSSQPVEEDASSFISDERYILKDNYHTHRNNLLVLIQQINGMSI